MSSTTSGDRFEDPGVMEVTGKVLIATIIALFLVLILVFLFHIYARWLSHRRQQTMDNNNPNRRRQGQHSGVTVLRRGLDETFLKTLPITLHDSANNNEPLECSVCLSQVEQGEKIRLLPKCNHAFHAECIDMWFHSHSTCPICRNSVSEQTHQVSVESLLENNQTSQQQHMSTDSQTSNFPANVLFWGDETEVSTLTSQLQELDQASNNHQTASLDQPTTSSNNDRLKPDLVIDIPRQVNEDDDEKTPIMRSLRRILSSTSRRFNPFSPQAAAAANNIDQASRS